MTSTTAFDPDGLSQSLGEKPRSAKLGQRVARDIEREIAAMGWPIGEVIGSEPELIARFGVSRAVFREAIRVLEDHKTAVMRRGPSGGLTVSAPDSEAIVRTVGLYLDYRQVDDSDLLTARAPIELRIVELATQRLDESRAAELRAHLAKDEEWAAEGKFDADTVGRLHSLHFLIASMADNKALELFLRVLVELTYEHVIDRFEASSQRTRRATVAHTLDIHRSLVDAMISGDSSLAVSRMRRHIEGYEQAGDHAI